MKNTILIVLALMFSVALLGCTQTSERTDQGGGEVIAPIDVVNPQALDENVSIPTSDLPEIIEPLNESEGDFPDLI